MDCDHLHRVDGCLVVKSLANGRTFRPQPQHCQFCSRVRPPLSINQVTIHLATRLFAPGDKADLARLAALEAQVLEQRHSRLRSVLDGQGVGSQLWRLLEALGIQHTESCPCLEWAERLNLWGIEGCRLARREISEHLRRSAREYGWAQLANAARLALATPLAWRLDLTDLYGSVLDEAIRRAEAAR